MDDEAIVIALEFPIEHGGKTFDEVKIPQRMKVYHLEAMDEVKGEIGKARALLAALSGLSHNVVRKMDRSDFEVVHAKIEEIMGPSEKKLP